ncbi:protein broad-minded-like [Leptopilina heterotoma]|uniref:protein broad-minded-like n=1 Tax=Leptopilina heterotoma TaxID=63436 RepID=UPI001CA8487B|nr:protein broad-minded-like [Leptopilina heterotoma]
METNLFSPDLRKWLRKCLSEQFKATIDKHLENDDNSKEVVEKLIDSREMRDLLQLIKQSLSDDKFQEDSEFPDRSRSLTSISGISDLSGDEWLSFKGSSDRYGQLLERIDATKPVHVRLAGYEGFLKRELSGIFSIQNWDYFLKILRDGIADDSRPIFEACLQLHAKLLNSPQPSEIYGNLMLAFNEQYQSKKINDILPTLISGVNYKVLAHEKLIRIMFLIVRHQEEVLKGVRTVDKSLEEMIEQFFVFISTYNCGSPIQVKTLSPLNILSILEPEASWSGKWIHSLTTRKAFCTALGKSPSLLGTIIQTTIKGLSEPPYTVSLSVTDDPDDFFISGETVETMTYLHSLTLLSQIISYTTGRTLLTETQIENPFSVTDFMTSLLTSLNILASSEIPSVIYEVSRSAFRYILHKPVILYDARFYHIAFNPLINSGDKKIYPHTLDVTMHMLDTADGISFMGSETRIGSANNETTNYPAIAVLEYTSDLLRQPLSVMNIELVADLFTYIGRLLTVYDVYEITQETLETKFYPAIAYFYGKLDKYAVENEIKTQFLNSSAKNMLLKIVSMPLGLQLLSGETIVFEELIRGSIGPLRASWNSTDVVSFISNSASFSLGVRILSELAPHVLSTLLNDLCKLLEDTHCFHDPWEERDVEIFLHLLTIFSLNTECFIAFMSTDETNSDDDICYPLNLSELYQHSVDSDSEYHYLSLLSTRAVIWNLDIYLFLENSLNLESQLLNLQRFCIIDIDEENYVTTDNHDTYIVDECSIMRHQILSDSYFVRQKRHEYTKQPEECLLFSKFPPPQGPEEGFAGNSSSDTDLEYFLEADVPGLRDSGWVSQARKAFRSSNGSMKSDVMLSLLDQMQKAIPTVEWVDHFTWETNDYNESYWLQEDLRGIELVLRYAELNTKMIDKEMLRENLKIFIQSSHDFIKYKKPLHYNGFDWFLSTVFIACDGDLEKSKNFVTQIVRFPSAIFLWPALADVVDKSNEEESTTRLLLAHLLEFLVSKEFPTIKYAMKNKCGVDWWTISLRLCHQSFWGILPWEEIIHFYAISILYPPDYIIYYCVSLLNHCQTDFMENVMNGKMWPEHLILEDYRCHSQIGYMDRLGKRYSGKLLPILSQRKLNFPEPK